MASSGVPRPFHTERIDHLYQDPHVDGRRLILHYGDMTDSMALMHVVEQSQPAEIYNLAAQSHVAVSFEEPEYTANADGLGALRLLESIRILGVAKFVAGKAARMIALAGKAVRGATVNLLGLTFKENVSDLRNSKVAELRAELLAQGAQVYVHDPIADPREAKHEHGIELEQWSALPRADALILAVAHGSYRERSTGEMLGKLAPGGCVLDVKGVLDLDALRGAGCACWRL